MEIILKKDVENLGFKDDIVQVKPGYARNYLIPKGMAILATESAKKILAENLRQKAHKEAKIIDDARKLAESMQAVEIKIPVNVGKGNKLFGSVSNADVSAHLSSMGFHVDKKYIYIPGTVIKNVGKYTAKIRLHRNVQFDLNFEVIGQ